MGFTGFASGKRGLWFLGRLKDGIIEGFATCALGLGVYTV